jgi:nicotinamide-nucleotide amidase
MVKAEIISVGTELLLGQIVDTNAVYLSRQLATLGIDLYHRTTVGDNPQRVKTAVAEALQRADLVITSGGLGPTEDDLTKEMVSEVLTLPLVLDQASWERIQKYFKELGRPLTQNNQKQALIPRGGQALRNERGTAPGVMVAKDGKLVFCLPGPPEELEPMFQEQVLPRLKGKHGVIASRVLKIASLGESLLAEKISDLLEAQTNPTIAPLAGKGEVTLRLTARAESQKEADGLLAALEAELRRRLGDVIYGIDEDTLAGVVLNLLRVRGQSLATAESCTGGLLASRLTDEAGASDVFKQGVVTYSNRAKQDLLGVPQDLIAREGAVSPQVAELMAQGVRKAAGTDWGIGITGIAGPGGGTPEKPVGLVYLALAAEDGVEVRELHWPGARKLVKRRTVIFALDLLRQHLLRKEKGSRCRNN